MKRAKRTIVIIGLALAGCSGPVHAPTVTPEMVNVRMFATTATYPLLEDLAHAYSEPGRLLAFETVETSWANIYAKLQSGEITFALTTYLPHDAHLWAAPLGYDAIVVIVHADNPVPNLSLDILARIFQGRISNWAEVGGPDMPITVISREDSADTGLAFRDQVMANQPITLAAQLALSNSSMVDLVASGPGAIGFVSLGHLSTREHRVRAVPIASTPQTTPYQPTTQSVRSGRYPLRTPLVITGLQPPSTPGSYLNWFAWMQNQQGQQIVSQHFVALQS